jgi:sulfite reductase (NADPH) flavoprotein alpha-component
MHSLESEQNGPGLETASEVLAQAESDQPSIGHSPKGFLSRTHGFLPIAPPLVALPKTHQAWDEVALMLPQLFMTQRVCAVLNELPLLSASDKDLDEVYLWRAAVLLGYMAHAYVYSANGKTQLPSNLAVPWEQVNQRLGRPGPGISTVDYCCYNWILKDTYGPRQVENLDLLVSWCGNASEVIFLTSITEMHSDSGKLVDAAIDLQSAILHHQVDNAKTALLRIFKFLRKMTFRALLKIDPNPYSHTHVDPLIWSKAFANITAPINAYERGLGGSGTPIIQLMDALFERGVYKTIVSHESLKLREWLPPYHRQFIETFRRFSLSDFIRQSDERELVGLYNSVFDAYAGKRGFLSMHRLKVYGFMELGFKIGRTETNSGFSGETEKRAWEELDDTLEQTRRERYVGKSPYSLRGKRKVMMSSVANTNTPIHQVVLDVKGQGLQFETGDRLGIFPQNSPQLVQKTLQALKATGDEPIRLTHYWREVLESLTYQRLSIIPLRTFLAFAKLRPLLRSVGKALLSLSCSRQLYEVLEARKEDQIELWDAFEILATENYDVKRFWKAAPWEAESIARIVPPEAFRIYSISSAPLNENTDGAVDELHLTVGRLSFESQSAGTRAAMKRYGTASGYLVQAVESAPEMAVQVFHPSRFYLPDDPERPIIMFAGGTGISPFRGFMQQRALQCGSGANWLFVGTRSFTDLPYESELRAWVAQGKLNLRVAFSREDKRLEFEQGNFLLQPGQRGYVDKLLEEPANSLVLWQYLQSLEQGGLEGYFYICGQASFAYTIIESIKRLIVRHLPDTIQDKDEAARRFFRRLMGQNRFMLDIFTTFAPVVAPSVHGFEYYSASEVIQHNNDQQGYWTVIQGNVYDVSAQGARLHARNK